MSGISFLHPWGFAAFSSLIVVFAIYLFYKRYTERKITGLFLWQAAVGSKMGGRQLQKTTAYRSLLLDLIACAFIALAVAYPLIKDKSKGTTVIILDNSFSMGVKQNHLKVITRVKQLMSENKKGTLVLVKAGERPQFTIVQEGKREPAEKIIAAYHPMDPSASVDKALEMARETISGYLNCYVFTDKNVLTQNIANAKITVQLFKGNFNNVALVEAARQHKGSLSEEIVIAVGNFSQIDQAVKLWIKTKDSLIQSKTIAMKKNEVSQMRYEMPQLNEPVYVTLSADEDGLSIDSKATLLSPIQRKVTWKTKIRENPLLEQKIEKAMMATGAIEASLANPDLIISNQTGYKGNLMTLHVVSSSTEKRDEEPFIGPFVVNMNHPLCRDIDLTGVYWSVVLKNFGSRIPLISVDENHLYYFKDDEILELNLDLSNSNVWKTTVWPVLFNNLVRAIELKLPGLHQNNYRQGVALDFVASNDMSQNPAEIQGNGVQMQWSSESTLPLLPFQPGVYQLKNDHGYLQKISINAISPKESNLLNLASRDRIIDKEGNKGNKRTGGTLADMPLGWLSLLLAFCFLLLNWILDKRQERRGK